MLDDNQFESAIQDLIIDICEVLYRRGYECVSIGAVMRLVGVEDEKARNHDHHIFPLDDDFERLLAFRKNTPNKKPSQDPEITLH